MKFCKQDISKTLTAMSFKLDQLIEHNEYITWCKFKKSYLIFLSYSLCKFGHKKFDISNTITTLSFKLGQVIVDNE